ncbi:MAG: AAA family ATPase [Gemmatimonadaceae bacterium]
MDVTGRDPPTYAPRIVLTTLGSVSLAVEPEEPGRVPDVVFAVGKPAALVAYLACAGGHSASREHLIDLLWSDLDRRAGQHALRVTLSRLKGAIGQQIVASGDNLTLGPGVHSDRDAFLAAVDRGDLEAAVTLYTGDFFPDFATPGTAAFEHWAYGERLHLRTTLARCADALVRAWLAAARGREAIALAQRIRDLDPLQQAGWRLLLEALIASRDNLRATIVADSLERLLAEEEMLPEPATRALLRAARHVGTGEDAASDARHGLVAELVGREREFSAILTAWERARSGTHAHLHLTAPAGMGKTRLLTDVRARIGAAQGRVVQVRGNLGAQGLSGALAGDLAMALAELPGALAVSQGVAGALVALNPALSNHYSAPQDRADGDEALRRRAIAIRELIIAVADEAPVAILIDDLQWADGASRTLLAGVLADLEGHPVLIVSAARPHGFTHGGMSSAVELALAPLSPAQIGAIVTSLGDLPDADWTAGLAGALHRATGGSPLLVLETLQLALDQGLLERDRNGWTAPDPGALSRMLHTGGALDRRLAEARDGGGTMLTILAVSGMSLSLDVLARASHLDTDSPQLLDRLAILERRGLVLHAGEQWQLAHDEYIAGVLDAVDPAAIDAAHAALGRALFLDPGDDMPRMRRAARHLAAGGEHQLLEALFTRFLKRARQSGDQRSFRALARDFLGEAGDAPAATRLVTALPLLVRMRLVTSRRVATAALAMVLVSAGIVTVVAASRSPAPPPPDAVLVIVHSDSSGTLMLHDFPLRRSEWRKADALDLRVQGAPRWRLPAVAAEWSIDELVHGYPDDGWWTGSRAVPDSGVNDIFGFGPDGRVRRLTALPADDVGPRWSPDGSKLAFRSGSFHPLRHADIAILDTATGRVRQLTGGDDSDGSPRWSPDGTRIAFARSYWDGRPPALCIIAVDGSGLRCLRPDGLALGGLLAWSSDRHVLVTSVLGSGKQALGRMEVETGRYEVVDSIPGTRRASPDGEWIACECERPGFPEGTRFVYPADRPEAARPIQVSGVDAEWQILWARPASRPRYLDSLLIDGGYGEPVRGLPYQLRASGLDPSGAPVRVAVLDWRSLDTLVATVDSTGLLRPRRAGRVTVALSAGGWRQATRTFTIGDAATRTVLLEDWRHGLTQHWMPFGQPHPTIVRDSDGAPALLNGNPGSFTSGVYSKRSHPSTDGLGLEVRLSTPVTMQQWQTATVGLYFGSDSATLAAWDHRTGYPPISGGRWAGSCGVSYPGGGEGHDYGNVISTSGGPGLPIPAPPGLRTGRWFTVRLQVFPDGRCGIAIDGRPIAVGPPQNIAGTTGRVMIDGQSYQTRVLAGRVELFTGVRTDMDWSSLLGAATVPAIAPDEDDPAVARPAP